jgi:mRNA-degrading endonuclease RelE of RelBE toxin-antitoxin system
LPAMANKTTIVVTMFAIRFGEDAVAEIAGLRSAERSRLLDAIERQLTDEPAGTSRRKKMLSGLVPPWEQVRPVWQLRVGDVRVFYDVDEPNGFVIVRAVRRKKRKRTEEIL